ncbi:hypothetical protein HPB50_018587 [Hyalomma asiaticum]|uniref:Uncharacterized protein n=1 Tax=Hyalomma asiaticum TaxID=266040 RepID=A0ACB7SPE6_HYAAI|nr:hypothetical protein HPB50_018587 [Hyalomma asiaticum]
MGSGILLPETPREMHPEKMGNMLVTFLVAAAVLLMVAMAILVLVYLTTSAEEKEYTREEEMNRDIADLLDSRDASGTVQGVDTTTGKSLLSGTLLCTMAAVHFSSTFVFPADGLCDIITFNSLFVNGGNTLSPPYDDDLSNFLSTASGHRITEYGIGIDHKNEGRVRDLISDPATKANLDDMWSQRVHHYGQVNTPVMEAIGNPLEYVTQSARGLQMIAQLMTDKAYSEDQPSHTILHYPLIYESMVAGVAEALM